MAAQHAAPASKKPSTPGARGPWGQDPNRFDDLDTPRYFTEVNVEGYKVAKTVAKSKKKHQQRQREEKRRRELQEPPAIEPVSLSKTRRTRTAPTKEQQCGDSFQLDL
jgi:hypothetical protein